MLFKPDLKETAKAAGDSVARMRWRARRRTVSIAITLMILGGLGYIAWTSLHQKQAANRGRPDLPVPVLAATPHIQDVPVYLDLHPNWRVLSFAMLIASGSSLNRITDPTGPKISSRRTRDARSGVAYSVGSTNKPCSTPGISVPVRAP